MSDGNFQLQKPQTQVSVQSFGLLGQTKTEANDIRVQTVAARDAAVNALKGDAYTTHAAALADIANIAPGAIVQIIADEDQGGFSTLRQSDGTTLNFLSRQNDENYQSAGVFDAVADAEANTAVKLQTGVQSLRTNGFHALGDGGGALYINPVAVATGKADEIFVPSINRYLRRAHEDGEISLAAHGLHGDGRDESVRFQDGMDLLLDVGLSKLVGRGDKTYRAMGLIPAGDMDIDLKGGTLESDYSNTTGSVGIFSAVNRKIRLMNLLMDGNYDPNGGPLAAGQPLLQLIGGDVTLWGFGLKKSGNLAGTGGAPAILDYRNQEILIHNADRCIIGQSSFADSLGEMLCIQSDDKRTHLEITSSLFSKQRSNDPANVWANSGLLIFNVAPTSFARGLRFEHFANSAANVLSDGFAAENIWMDDIRSSSGWDTTESAKALCHNAKMRNIHGRNIPNGGIVRIGGNNVSADVIDHGGCKYGVLFEATASGPQSLGAWMDATPKETFGSRISCAPSEDYAAGTPSDAQIYVRGASAALMSYIDIIGTSDTDTGSPSINGVNTQNAELTFHGGLMTEGDTNLIIHTGAGGLRFNNVRFKATGDVLTLNAVAANTRIEFNNCTRIGALNSGKFDIQRSGATTGLATLTVALNNSPTLDTFEALTGALILRDGFIQTDAEYIHNQASGIRGTAHEEYTIAGARIGDTVTVNMKTEDSVFRATGRVIADDTVEVSVSHSLGNTVAATPRPIIIDVRPRTYL